MIKIAVPDNQLYSNLYMRWNEIADIDFRRLSESNVSRQMLRNEVDLALLNPESYGVAVSQADYRIIPGPALATLDYTGVLSLFFKEGLRTITKCRIPPNDDFFLRIGKILLAENFNLYPEYIPSDFDDNDDIIIPSEFDSALVWKESSYSENALDISEEWYQNFEIPLPLLFWVCRAESTEINFIELIQKISNNELLKEEKVFDYTGSDDSNVHRQGKLIWYWNDEFENALEQVLHLLYFHQLLSDIAAVKILGRD